MALILIVDDDATIREMLAEFVSDAGHTAITARHGADALAKVQAQPPALIISDVMMPVMDGYAFLQAIREMSALSHTQIFLMSAAFDAHPPPVLDEPPDGYLAKPFELAMIEAMLAHLPPSHDGASGEADARTAADNQDGLAFERLRQRQTYGS